MNHLPKQSPSVYELACLTLVDRFRRALGDRLKTYFIQNGLTREGKPEQMVGLFATLGVKVQLVDARDELFTALRGITDAEQKREAVAETFYKKVLARLVQQSGAKYLLRGTILADQGTTLTDVWFFGIAEDWGWPPAQPLPFGGRHRRAGGSS